MLLLITCWSKIWCNKPESCRRAQQIKQFSKARRKINARVKEDKQWRTTCIPLSLCFSPTPQRLSARTQAKVVERASLTNMGWGHGRPHEPSWDWFSNNQLTHSGKQGACGEFSRGTIATQAVSYEDTESSTLSNIFLILSLVASNPWIQLSSFFLTWS